jgi:hypothetical protein
MGVMGIVVIRLTSGVGMKRFPRGLYSAETHERFHGKERRVGCHLCAAAVAREAQSVDGAVRGALGNPRTQGMVRLHLRVN